MPGAPPRHSANRGGVDPKRVGNWTEDDEHSYRLFHSEPDRALACILAAMNHGWTTDLGRSGAGPLEDFLGFTARHIWIRSPRWHGASPLARGLERRLAGLNAKRVWHRIELLKQSAFS